MRRSLAAATFWSLLCAVPLAQQQPEQPVYIVVHSNPPGAFVYLQSVAKNGNLVPMKPTGQPILIDKKKFQQTLFLVIGGPPPDPAHPNPMAENEIPNYHGYLRRRLDLTRWDSNPAPPGTSDLPVYNLPTDPMEPPFELYPAPGAGAWFARTALWFQLHPAFSLCLALGGFALAFGVIGVAVPRYKSWKEHKEKVDEFNARLRNLDVRNDVFLARQFGQWVTVKRLGAGGMAVVYKGVSVDTMDESQAVAIKVMNPELAQDLEYRRRFNREVQISRTLDHPNVVRMIDFGEQDGVLYLSMEYIQGETLRDKLPERGMPLPEALPLALGIANGLIHAHNKGIVHRDLKPDNIMVTDTGLVKVMDLGLAKREESENVTRTGDTFGTPAYMSPEQITGGTLMPATDQYAFGVMLFEMLTGRRPFEVEDSLTLVMKHLQEPPPRVRQYKSHLPEELEALIDRMLAKDPARRYKNLVEVQVELTKIERKYCPK